MGFTAGERQELLSAWIKPSSDDEVVQQDRAERMIAEAIKSHPAFNSVDIDVYAKGSYANNTNVRRDSDVDIVVQCNECFYFDYAQGVTLPTVAPNSYKGEWTPDSWREEVTEAMTNEFGADGVDASGKIALLIPPVPGSRPSIDVVPSFDYRLYWSSDRSRSSSGSCVHKRSGARIINWPKQQLDNGRAKNDRTGKRYKRYVRALKNAENRLADLKIIEAKPSYLMECLVWNVAEETLNSGTLDTGFEATLVELWAGLKDEEIRKDWEEPNGIKYLFHSSQKWNVSDAREVILETWRYLDY